MCKDGSPSGEPSLFAGRMLPLSGEMPVILDEWTGFAYNVMQKNEIEVSYEE